MKTTTEGARSDAGVRSAKSPPKDFGIGPHKNHQPNPAVLKLTNILVPIDFSMTSQKALMYAVPFAREFDARITLVHAIETLSYAADMSYAPTNGEFFIAPAERKLVTLGRDAVGEPFLSDVLVRVGTPFEVITNVAREWDVDLIVMTTHGYTGIQHFLQGSITERVVREAPCPVLVVHPTEHEFV